MSDLFEAEPFEPHELYQHWNYVLGFAIRYGCDRDDAEDVAQLTMIDAYRTRAKWERRATLRTWLCGIARHKVQDVQRTRMEDSQHFEAWTKRQGLVYLPVDEDYEADPGPGCARFVHEWHPPVDRLETMEDVIARKEEASEISAQVDGILKQLPTHYRRLLILQYVDGLSVRGIARKIKCSESATESMLGRAKTAFRAVWNNGKGEKEKS